MKGPFMKSVACEKCNSYCLVEAQGLVSCQNCGQEYTLERVKKLSIYNAGRSKHEVSAEEADEVSRIVKMARARLSKGDFVKAKEQAEMALGVDPSDPSAYFVFMLASDLVEEPSMFVDFKASDHLAWLVREKHGAGSRECFEHAESYFREMVDVYSSFRKTLKRKPRGSSDSAMVKSQHAYFVRKISARLLYFASGIGWLVDLDKAPQSYADIVGTTLTAMANYPYDKFCKDAMRDLIPLLLEAGKKHKDCRQGARQPDRRRPLG